MVLVCTIPISIIFPHFRFRLGFFCYFSRLKCGEDWIRGEKNQNFYGLGLKEGVVGFALWQ
jgi:hypothetical protein